MKHLIEKLERLLEAGGIKKDAVLLVISGIAVICSLLKFQPFPFDMSWIAIILCGIPSILEAVIGLVTAAVLSTSSALLKWRSPRWARTAPSSA